jgi:hypothetical protein
MTQSVTVREDLRDASQKRGFDIGYRIADSGWEVDDFPSAFPSIPRQRVAQQIVDERKIIVQFSTSNGERTRGARFGRHFAP